MLSRTRLFTTAILSGVCLGGAAIDTIAQGYPARPVRVVIAYAAGGPTDLLGRTVAQKLGEILGEPFVVENRPGGGGTIGAAAVAKAPADGYTLFFETIAGLSVNHSVYKSLPYDARKDFTPIGPVASGAVFLWVNSSLPARDLKELVALAKSKPGQLSFGSAGRGQYPTHIGPELFKLKNGLDLMNVPYKGAAPAMLDVAAGRISFVMTAGLAAARPYLDAGKVRALAVTGDKRAAALPNVPTFAEAGSPLPEMSIGGWFGFLGPAGLPRNIVVKLSQSIATAMASPDVLARLGALSLEPMTATPEAFADLFNTAIDTWAPVLRRMNITPE
ncbi:MAG: tripartite tricarboxylate transporter substrate binding protein [Betaproteobacteria bacterium]|nr:tripartite tricarboxylate transporter substrate binding protein [Betaproteobacteria bacterium]